MKLIMPTLITSRNNIDEHNFPLIDTPSKLFFHDLLIIKQMYFSVLLNDIN